MKKIILFLLIMLIPIKSYGLEVSASSAILMDMDSERILYAKNIHETRGVASISKIMTAVIAIESGKLDKEVTIGEEIKKAYGSAIYIQVGEKMKLRDLVYGLMLRSGNDASLAIAKYVGNSVEEFVTMMNNKAQEIGMKNTIFRNPNGLDQEDGGNISTAYDMAILTSYAMKLDDYKEIVKTKEYTLKTNKNTYVWHNKNKLLFQYEYTTGGKTGYTEKARRTLVTTASKDNLNLVSVTLNDGNDFSDHKDMFNYGFKNYKRFEILKEGDLKLYDDIYYGIYDLKLLDDYSYAINKDDKVVLKYELEEQPREGVCGNVLVYINDKEVTRQKIIATKRKQSNTSFWKWIGKLW